MADGKVTIDSEINDKGLEQGLSNLQGKLEETGKKIQNVGSDLTKKLTLPLTAAAGFAVKLGMDFESGMAQVAAVTGATADEMQALEDQARELGSTTQFSALQAAEGMQFLGRAGFATTEIMDAMPGLLDLAAAGAVELGAAADITTNILSGFGLEASEAGRVADVLALATASSKTDVEGMGESMKYVAPVASSLGISVEDTAAAIGLLGDAGVEGGQAGTTLRRGLLNLASPTDQMTGLMEELGLEMFDAEGNMKSLPEVIAELESGLEGMTSKQRSAALSTLFGAQAVSGWSALLDAGSDSLGSFSGELGSADGTASDMATTMMDTSKGSLLEMRSALEEVAIRIYEALQPALNSAIEFITDLAQWFNGLSDEMVTAIVIIGGIVAAVGPFLVVLGTIVSLVGKALGAIKAFGLAFAKIAGPVGIAIAIIGALIGIGILLYQNWDTVKAKAIEVFSHFQPLLETVKGAFQTLMDSTGPIMESLKTLWQSLIPLLQNVGAIVGGVLVSAFGILVSTFNGVIAAIGPLINAFINFVDYIVNMVNMVVALFTGDFAGAWEYLKAAGQSTIDMFMNLFEGLINFVSTFVTSIIDFFAGLYNTLVGNSIIPDMVNAIVDWFKNMLQWVVDLVKSIVDGVINFFTSLQQGVINIFNAVKSFIQSVWNGIKNTISTVVNSIRSIINSVFNGIRSIINSVMNGIRSTISSIWNGIRSTVSSVVNGIRNTISNIFNSLKGIVSNAFSAVRSAVSSGITGAYKAVTGKVKDFFNAGKNIVTSIADGIKGAVGKVTGAISNVASKIRDFLPFSPAKEGPLMDLNRLDFEGPIGDSLENAIPDVQAKMNAMLKVPTMNPTNMRTVPKDLESKVANDNRKINITVDASNLDEVNQVLEIFAGLKQTVRRG